MSIYISVDFVATSDNDINGNNPVIGYDNQATTANLHASSENANFPASNMVNPSTALAWNGLVGDNDITVTVNNVEPVDYLAIAKHNLGSTQCEITVEGLAVGNDSPDDWFTLVGPVLLADDSPALFRFTAQSLYGVRLHIEASPLAVAPSVAVLYVGKLLVLQRRLYVGHAPINYNLQTNVVNGMSESGNFLGRIVLSDTASTALHLQNVTPSWFRQFMPDFIAAARETPFFFAWRPDTYPAEVGYCWLTNNISPSNQLQNGMMQFDMSLGGIA